MPFEFTFDFTLFIENMISWCHTHNLKLNYNNNLNSETTIILTKFVKIVKLIFGNKVKMDVNEDLTTTLYFINTLQLFTYRILHLWFPFWFNKKFQMSMMACNNVDFFVSALLERCLLCNEICDEIYDESN